MKKLFCDVCKKETTTVYKIQIIQHDSIDNHFTSSEVIDKEICESCLDKMLSSLDDENNSSNYEEVEINTHIDEVESEKDEKEDKVISINGINGVEPIYFNSPNIYTYINDDEKNKKENLNQKFPIDFNKNREVVFPIEDFEEAVKSFLNSTKEKEKITPKTETEEKSVMHMTDPFKGALLATDLSEKDREELSAIIDKVLGKLF